MMDRHPSRSRREEALLFAWSAMLLVAPALAVSPANAQVSEPPALQPSMGVVVAARAAIERGLIPAVGADPECGSYETGWAVGGQAGGTVRLPLTRSGLCLDGELTLSHSAARFSALPDPPTEIYDTTLAMRVTVDRQYRLAISEWHIDARLLASIPFGALHFSAGLTLSKPLALRATSSDIVKGPGKYRFSDGQSEHDLSPAPMTSAPIALAPSLRLSFDIDAAGNSRSISPFLQLELDALSRLREWNLRSVACVGGVAVRWALPKRPPPALAGPPPVRGPAPRLAVSVLTYALDATGEAVRTPRVRVAEINLRTRHPLIPVIFFGSGSDSLGLRSARLTPAEADTFSLGSLAGTGPLKVARAIPDILGWRLRNEPEGLLRIWGLTAPDEPAWLAGRRRERLRQYLSEVWGIDRSRVVDGAGAPPVARARDATADGRDENRSVVIEGDPASLLAPLTIDRVTREFSPPAIRIRPTIDAEAGVDRWELVIRQAGHELTRISSADPRTAHPRELSWEIPADRVDSILDPIVVTLEVIDSIGTGAIASDSLPLILERTRQVIDDRYETGGRRERIIARLVGFDYDVSAPKQEALFEIRDIAAMTRRGARIRIVGFTDRIGELQHNLSLSLTRAEGVAAVLRQTLEMLGVEDVTIQSLAGGVDQDRFSNDTPEGRVLSRGVEVIVEQASGQ